MLLNAKGEKVYFCLEGDQIFVTEGENFKDE